MNKNKKLPEVIEVFPCLYDYGLYLTVTGKPVHYISIKELVVANPVYDVLLDKKVFLSAKLKNGYILWSSVDISIDLKDLLSVAKVVGGASRSHYVSRVRPAYGKKGYVLLAPDGYSFQDLDEKDSELGPYNWIHSEAEIVIDCKETFLYEYSNGNRYLDHAPQTLGYIYAQDSWYTRKNQEDQELPNTEFEMERSPLLQIYPPTNRCNIVLDTEFSGMKSHLHRINIRPILLRDSLKKPEVFDVLAGRIFLTNRSHEFVDHASSFDLVLLEAKNIVDQSFESITEHISKALMRYSLSRVGHGLLLTLKPSGEPDFKLLID